MSSAREIKKRIKSVRNTSQITKAMEAVAATKMRKSQQFALRARPYAVAGLELLGNLLERAPILPELLRARPVSVSALLVITSDKGLAGSFNASVIKKAEQWLTEKKKTGARYALITAGKKSKDYFERRGEKINASFTKFGDFSNLAETAPVADVILDGFSKGEWDEVESIYTNFRTTLKQEAVLRKVLPIRGEGVEEIVRGLLPESGKYAEKLEERPPNKRPVYNHEYKFEPTQSDVLEKLVPQLLRMIVHHLILESNASEHSARMVAMKNASDNAGELIDSLSMLHNKIRQAGITRELTEITAGADALY